MTNRLEQGKIQRREAIRDFLLTAGGITGIGAINQNLKNEDIPLIKKPVTLVLALGALFSLIGGTWIQKSINDNQSPETTPLPSPKNPHNGQTK